MHLPKVTRPDHNRHLSLHPHRTAPKPNLAVTGPLRRAHRPRQRELRDLALPNGPHCLLRRRTHGRRCRMPCGRRGRRSQEAHAERGCCQDLRYTGAGAQSAREWRQCGVLERQVRVGLYCVQRSARARQDELRGPQERRERQSCCV